MITQIIYVFTAYLWALYRIYLIHNNFQCTHNGSETFHYFPSTSSSICLFGCDLNGDWECKRANLMQLFLAPYRMKQHMVWLCNPTCSKINVAELMVVYVLYFLNIHFIIVSNFWLLFLFLPRSVLHFFHSLSLSLDWCAQTPIIVKKFIVMKTPLFLLRIAGVAVKDRRQKIYLSLSLVLCVCDCLFYSQCIKNCCLVLLFLFQF